MSRFFKAITQRPPWIQRFHKVEQGYDPIDPKHAEKYAAGEWGYYEAGSVNRTVGLIEGRMGSLAGKRILDLGAGPGQYAIAFALRGALVTWHDPSRTYLGIAQAHAAKNQVSCEWSLGYLEGADKFKEQPFDLVFCRICWFYCISDGQFAQIIHSLLKPGGYAWIDVPTSVWQQATAKKETGLKPRLARYLKQGIYRHTGLKFEYFAPDPGQVSRLFGRYDFSRLDVDITDDTRELIWFQRPKADGVGRGAPGNGKAVA